VDVLRCRRWAFPLIVVGVNSIAIYCMGSVMGRWTAWMLRTHFGCTVFLGWGPLNEPALRAILVGLCYWLACLWMYRQKIFIRI